MWLVSVENSSIFSLIECTSCNHQWYVGAKLLKEDHQVFNWGCWLTQVDCIVAMKQDCVIVTCCICIFIIAFEILQILIQV